MITTCPECGFPITLPYPVSDYTSHKIELHAIADETLWSMYTDGICDYCWCAKYL